MPQRRRFGAEFFRAQEREIGKIDKKIKARRQTQQKPAPEKEPTSEELKAQRERTKKEMREFLEEPVKLSKKSKTQALSAKEREALAKEETVKRAIAAEKYSELEQEMSGRIEEEEKKRLEEKYFDMPRRGHKRGFKPPKTGRETIREQEKLPESAKRAIGEREIIEEIHQEEREERRKAA